MTIGIAFVLGLAIGVIVTFLYYPKLKSFFNPEPGAQEISRPKDLMEVVDTKEVYDMFTKKRANVIEEYEGSNGKPNFKATRYGEWDFEYVENYLNYLKQVNQQVKETSPYKGGIEKLRLYFGTYPDKSTLASGKKIIEENGILYSGRSTFFLTPTLLVDREQTPFALEKNTYNPVLLTNELNAPKAKSNTQRRDQSQSSVMAMDSLSLNEVNLTPPPF